MYTITIQLGALYNSVPNRSDHSKIDEISQKMIVSGLGPNCKISALGDAALSDVAAEVHGKMLAYRLSNYSRIRVSHPQSMNLTHQTREIAMNLAAVYYRS